MVDRLNQKCYHHEMRTYQAFYRGRNLTVTAASQFDAQKQAAILFKARRAWDVAVVLADVPVKTAELG